MKPAVYFALGLLLGGTAWAWQRSAGNHLTVGMVKMQGDGVVMMGKEAANALAKGSPEALRDFANYAVDNGLARAQSGTTTGTYDEVLRADAAAIPADRRVLSADAPRLYTIARPPIQTK